MLLWLFGASLVAGCLGLIGRSRGPVALVGGAGSDADRDAEGQQRTFSIVRLTGGQALADIPTDQLPDALQDLAPAEQQRALDPLALVVDEAQAAGEVPGVAEGDRKSVV